MRPPQREGSGAKEAKEAKKHADCRLAVGLRSHVSLSSRACVLVNVTPKSDVPVMVTRGNPSLTYLDATGEAIEADSYYFDDHDPSGVDTAVVADAKDQQVWGTGG
jgi:hypothetical protein